MSNVILKSKVNKDKYTNYIQDAFDLKVEDVCSVEIPNNLNINKFENWNIGVICGASGSGKSTLLNELGKVKSPMFDNNKALISNFDMLDPMNATMLLSSIGLSSVPTWIRPFNVLSNGEKYRASLAKVLAESNGDEIILVDEYTSVVDRNVAKSMSNSLQKYIRRHNKKIILATCHYDIFDWLQPDWIYDLNKGGTLEKGGCLRQRPKIELQVYRTTNDTWEFFKKYHYMTQDLNKSASCFCFTWDAKLVAFVATLPMPSGTIKNAFRESRTVVLPDFQGLGLGSKVSEFIAGIYKAESCIYYTKTVNPALGEYRNKSKNWEGTSFNGKERTDLDMCNNGDGIFKHYYARKSYCHKYVGEPIYGYDALLEKANRLRYNKKWENQLTLF